MEKFDTSEYKITYLLGAGASAKSLPTVKPTKTSEGLSRSLQLFAEKIKADKIIKSSYKVFIDNMASDLSWLSVNSEKFGTPDTFAKYLYLQEKESLKRLKNALSFYFTVEQLINKKFDNRALIFLTTVMQIGNIFPTNIKILNWNYDIQIQMAAEVFRNEKFGFDNKSSIHSPPLINYYPSLGFEFPMNHESNDINDFSLVHLNGVAGYYFNEQKSLILNSFIKEMPNDINEIIEKVITENGKKLNLITFAWEEDTEAAKILRNRMKIAKAIIANTDILIIIGYSFPFFNRVIDKQIFDSALESGKLKKIIYQDPFRTGEFLIKQFNITDNNNIEIINIEDKDNYYVPNEL